MPCDDFESELVHFMKLYRNLPDRERAILAARFGFDGSSGLSLEKVGRLHGISSERVRQIEKHTLDKMYAAMR